ncbi:hypothetical protein [Rhizobium alvei]|uniref:Cysteine rich repeat-containing protein n=1 Tax=Rhizobium alvei TaxID=1132659 RepID=A0ABT8YRL3_9HYPH|nr:hypothetical protein [Rhizobium alvei]MDO6966350.1 hypothetical protein [Rhizobium alvei]
MKSLLPCLFLVLAASTSQAAQLNKQDMQAIRDVCQSDVMRLCFGVRPGGGRLKQCIDDKRDRLSEPCRAKLAEVEAARNKAEQAAE